MLKNWISICLLLCSFHATGITRQQFQGYPESLPRPLFWKRLIRYYTMKPATLYCPLLEIGGLAKDRLRDDLNLNLSPSVGFENLFKFLEQQSGLHTDRNDRSDFILQFRQYNLITSFVLLSLTCYLLLPWFAKYGRKLNLMLRSFLC